MNSLASEWLVLNRPQVAGFHSPGDTASLVSPVFSITSATVLRSPALRSAAIFWRTATALEMAA